MRLLKVMALGTVLLGVIILVSDGIGRLIDGATRDEALAALVLLCMLALVILLIWALGDWALTWWEERK